MSTTPARTRDDAAAPPRRRPITLAFMNQKGGVGKTTTVVNVAAAMAQRGRRVLVIDMDPQAHASLHLGHDPAELDGSVYDVLLEPSLVSDAIVKSRENLAVLPAEVDLAAAEVELATGDDRHGRLTTAIDLVASDFDVVMIDCPPSLGLLTLNALAAADSVIVPMQAHFLALQGVSKLLETVQLMSQKVNPRLRVAGVVLCMHDEQTTHGREVVADLDAFFEQAAGSNLPWAGGRVFRPGVRRNIKLAESPSFGQTIFEYAPAAPGAEDYAELAKVILNVVCDPHHASAATEQPEPALPEVQVRPAPTTAAASA